MPLKKISSPPTLSRHVIFPPPNVNSNFCVLLNESLKTERCAALVYLGKNWYGLITSYTEKEKSSMIDRTNLFQSIKVFFCRSHFFNVWTECGNSMDSWAIIRIDRRFKKEGSTNSHSFRKWSWGKLLCFTTRNSLSKTRTNSSTVLIFPKCLLWFIIFLAIFSKNRTICKFPAFKESKFNNGMW